MHRYNTSIVAKDIEKLSKEYQKFIEELDSESLKLVTGDFSVALEYARKGMEQVDPGNLNNQSIQQIAIEMQNIANMVLRERSIN